MSYFFPTLLNNGRYKASEIAGQSIHVLDSKSGCDMHVLSKISFSIGCLSTCLVSFVISKFRKIKPGKKTIAFISVLKGTVYVSAFYKINFI